MKACKRLILFTIAGAQGFSFGYISHPPFLNSASAMERASFERASFERASFERASFEPTSSILESWLRE